MKTIELTVPDEVDIEDYDLLTFSSDDNCFAKKTIDAARQKILTATA